MGVLLDTVSLELVGGIPTIAAEACFAKEYGCKADEARDHLLTWAQARFGEDEFVKAKEEYFWQTGKVFYDDSFYHARMEYFTDFFLLERPLSQLYGADLCLTPYKIHQQSINSEQLAGLEQFEHTLLQITKVYSDRITAVNLIKGEQVSIFPRSFESFRAISKKEIVQGFLYQSEQKWFFGRGMLFHPLKANRFIKKELKKLKIGSEFDTKSYLATLAKLQLKHLRHTHVDPKRIYCPG
jgi:hypothetical protein